MRPLERAVVVLLVFCAALGLVLVAGYVRHPATAHPPARYGTALCGCSPRLPVQVGELPALPSQTPTAASYAVWRAGTPHLIATGDELQAAFEAAGIPAGDAARLVVAWTTCEAPVRDVTGHVYGADLYRVGDNGLAIGPGQFRTDVWGAGSRMPLLTEHDPHTVDGAAAIAAAIRAEYIREGQPSLAAWSCVKGG